MRLHLNLIGQVKISFELMGKIFKFNHLLKEALNLNNELKHHSVYGYLKLEYYFF